MASAALGGDVSLEVHLPQIVGLGVLESLPGLVLAALGGVHHTVAPEDGSDGAGAGSCGHAQGSEPGVELASAPGRVLPPKRYYPLLDRRRGPFRCVVRPPRAVRQTGHAISTESGEPLISGPGADAVTAAQLSHIGLGLAGQGHELVTRRHGGHLLPGHVYLHSGIIMPSMGVYHVPEHPFTMCPVHTVGGEGGEHMAGTVTSFINRALFASLPRP